MIDCVVRCHGFMYEQPASWSILSCLQPAAECLGGPAVSKAGAETPPTADLASWWHTAASQLPLWRAHRCDYRHTPLGSELDLLANQLVQLSASELVQQSARFSAHWVAPVPVPPAPIQSEVTMEVDVVPSVILPLVKSESEAAAAAAAAPAPTDAVKAVISSDQQSAPDVLRDTMRLCLDVLLLERDAREMRSCFRILMHLLTDATCCQIFIV
jgi:hypothetical protein